tara:strand:- start:219 stop:866 length:648 start_codon:yes stop_codon:yes gene_type:complete
MNNNTDKFDLQVDASHYNFSNYLTKRRWISLWHQIDEVLRFEPQSVLEVGAGPELARDVLTRAGVSMKTVDIDPDLAPDIVAQVQNIPCENASYDVVCAFQVLEHMPYDQALLGLQEMARIASKGVIISVPNSKRLYRSEINLHPRLPSLSWSLPHFNLKRRIPKPGSEHLWELDYVQCPISTFRKDLMNIGYRILREYRVPENAYHHFFILEKI